ncbi:hypothetical protein QO004_004235 [Rhizobium mesoamericanum]|uniref:hypothetical protein n=1 Tax=Rhizobium mesoamericanum TaxID=1079800 RepID=UPI0027869738|nr:hypothetical protein [Rhizobium mesoamericanum]MDQ0562430.1 hypothetical protein [Rhizobium mesoamericanum]
MQFKILAVAVLSLGMATSALAQSNPVPNNMAGDKTPGQDAGGGASGDVQTQTGTNKRIVVDPNATNSTTGANTNSTGTVDRSRCPAQPAPGSVATQGGNGGASKSEACPDNQ